MKIVLWIVGGLVTILVLVLLIGSFMPSEVTVKSTVISRASDTALFKLVNNLQDWSKWSAWARMDRAMKMEYSEQKEGSGAWYKWQSTHDKVGEGMLTLDTVVPYSRITTGMKFKGMDKTMKSVFTFMPFEGATTVSMSMKMDFGSNPILRLMGPIYVPIIQKDFDACVKNLDSTANAQAKR